MQTLRYPVDSKPPFGLTLLLALQHLLAALGGIIAIPLVIIAISIGCGLAVTTRPELLNKLPSFFKEVFGSGITVGSVLALVLNLILPEDKE